MAGTMRKGNWFEEAALEKYTGIKEFKPQDKTSGKFTYVRCIEHTDRLDPKNFESVMASCIKDPSKHEHSKLLKDKVGPRKALLEASMKAEVNASVSNTQALAYTKNREVEYVSENGRNFNRPNFKASLSEDVDPTRTKTYSANYCTEAPITFYTECANAGAVTFPASFVVSESNPFRKSSAFSVDIKNANTILKTESNERPRPFPTVVEFSGVKSFKERLISHVSNKLSLKCGTGKVMNKIVTVLWSLLSSDVPNIHIDDLINGLDTELGFQIGPKEIKGVLATFNDDKTENISLPEMTDYLRGGLNPRSGELVDIILSRINTGDDGSVSEMDVKSLYKGTDDIAINKAGGFVTIDDLYEYFTDCSAELGTPEKFESMLNDWM
jgi:Ca2+-binding EF-hand superfamily protein